MAAQSCESVECQYETPTGARRQPTLLPISFLGHQGKCHCISGLWLNRSLFATSRVSTRRSHGKRYVEHGLSLKSSRLHALGHHLLECPVEIGLYFRITFLFLARNE